MKKSCWGCKSLIKKSDAIDVVSDKMSLFGDTAQGYICAKYPDRVFDDVGDFDGCHVKIVPFAVKRVSGAPYGVYYELNGWEISYHLYEGELKELMSPISTGKVFTTAYKEKQNIRSKFKDLISKWRRRAAAILKGKRKPKKAKKDKWPKGQLSLF